ncbi:hypothetical protein [Rhodoblastus sp.]|uniref:hypothetical protein n=1 Tax=Rhodoblastus sp. TaxID=1962975 RepID=UPI00261C9518|nr:hypothetical protein [Rhodoblastus sp.]
MGQYRADVVIHVNETLDEAQLRDVEQELCARHGVVSATHSPGRNHLLAVFFDPQITTSANLLMSVKARGLHAQRIGL